MEHLLNELMQNRILWNAVCAWFVAQILKVVVIGLLERRLDLQMLFSAGGMPSSHTALVTGLSTMIALDYGLSSVHFAISFVLAAIVMYDATGVRRAAGKQAMVLNQIIDEYFMHHILSEQHLKELIGHTPFQVFVGAIVGITTALIIG